MKLTSGRRGGLSCANRVGRVSPNNSKRDQDKFVRLKTAASLLLWLYQQLTRISQRWCGEDSLKSYN